MGHARMGAAARLGPIVERPRVAEALCVSLETHAALTQVSNKAPERVPDGDGGQIARAAVAAAGEDFGLTDQPDTGLPFLAMPTLPVYLRGSERP
jgi:hypothetical protein